MTETEASHHDAGEGAGHASRSRVHLAGAQSRPVSRVEDLLAVSMRELGKLTRDDLVALDHPVPITSGGEPVAWLMPMTEAERHRVHLLATGRIRPARRPENLRDWQPLPPREDGVSLSQALIEMREAETR